MIKLIYIPLWIVCVCFFITPIQAQAPRHPTPIPTFPIPSEMTDRKYEYEYLPGFVSADWTHFLGRVSGITEDTARQIADASPEVTYFYVVAFRYIDNYEFEVGDILFFSGDPELLQQSGNGKSYIKKKDDKDYFLTYEPFTEAPVSIPYDLIISETAYDNKLTYDYNLLFDNAWSFPPKLICGAHNVTKAQAKYIADMLPEVEFFFHVKERMLWITDSRVCYVFHPGDAVFCAGGHSFNRDSGGVGNFYYKAQKTERRVFPELSIPNKWATDRFHYEVKSVGHTTFVTDEVFHFYYTLWKRKQTGNPWDMSESKYNREYPRLRLLGCIHNITPKEAKRFADTFSEIRHFIYAKSTCSLAFDGGMYRLTAGDALFWSDNPNLPDNKITYECSVVRNGDPVSLDLYVKDGPSTESSNESSENETLNDWIESLRDYFTR